MTLAAVRKADVHQEAEDNIQECTRVEELSEPRNSEEERDMQKEVLG
jgi:hypothetical protein